MHLDNEVIEAFNKSSKKNKKILNSLPGNTQSTKRLDITGHNNITS